MRKALLIVAMLLLASPVMATTTITAVAETPQVTADGKVIQTIRIDYSSTVDVRAFALDINVEPGLSCKNIRDFKTGESNAVTKGYGIFPSRFRDFINVLGPDTNDPNNWADGNYNPTPAYNEPGTISPRTGMGWPTFTVEMGTLYLGDANKPALSGTLFRFDANSEGLYGTFHVTIAANALRGGVVNNDGNSIAGTYNGCSFVVNQPCISIPAILNSTMTDANTALTTAGFTNPPAITYECNNTYASGRVCRQDTGCVTSGTVINYVVSTGSCATAPDMPSALLYPAYDSDCNVPIFWAACTGATGYNLQSSHDRGATWTAVYAGTATYKQDTNTPGWYRYRICAYNAVGTSAWRTGAVDANVYLSTCYGTIKNPTDPNWTEWVKVGRPDCWCKASTNQEPNGSGYQCDGDSDGTKSTAGYRVFTGDSAILSSTWKWKVSNVTMDPNITMSGKLKVSKACADFDHKQSTAGYRVFTADSGILSAKWKYKDSSVTSGNKLLGNCPR